MDFEKTYENTPEHFKLKYLYALLQHNDKLKNEFLAFVASHDPQNHKPSYESFVSKVSATQKIYQAHFESVDIENPDWDSYTPSYSGYIEEWEQYREASEQDFQQYFQLFLSNVMDTITAQRPDELLAMLVGLYKAAMDADVPDEVGSFESVNDYLLSELIEIIGTISKEIRLAALVDNKVNSSFELFFHYCNEVYPEHPHFANHFEPVLIALAEKTENLGQLLDIMTQAGIEQAALPEFTLLLYRTLGNTKSWLKAAQQLYNSSEVVARELLQYYFENDKPAFVLLSHELLTVKTNDWAAFLEPYVSPQLDESLFVKVFSRLTIAKQNIQHYQKLKPYLNEETYQHIIQQLRWNKVFLVKLLEDDKRYADIKALVEKESDRWNFAELIAPIVSVYPDFCFAKIKAMVVNTLDNERGRSTYERIAKWLSLARLIPNHEADAIHLINITYAHKPNLPALKDEMRKAGLV